MEQMMEEFEAMRKDESRIQIPYVFGFSFKIGPEGKPVFRQFGNVRHGDVRPRLTKEREPLVDIYDDGDRVTVLVEVPGVRREDIHMNVCEEEMEIKVDSEDRRYHKLITLPVPVLTDSVETRYRNGVLQVNWRKKEKRTDWKSIRLE